VRADMADQYMAAVKEDLLPAVRKSGLKVFVFSRARYGATTNEFHISTDLGSWSDLDSTSPVVKAMGQENYNKFLAKIRPMTIESEWNIYRYEPDLSYIAPTK
jgi:hypothetical protein